MYKGMMAGVALALAALPGGAFAQEGAKFDCVVTSVTPGFKESLGVSMAGGGDELTRDVLFKQLATITDGCVTRHGISEDQKAIYFDYSLARISREWLVPEVAKYSLSTAIVDKALDFGPGRANPDLTGEMTEDQIGAIVQGYIDSGVDIEKIDGAAWEKVGAYAAATSIYWNKRSLLPF